MLGIPTLTIAHTEATRSPWAEAANNLRISVISGITATFRAK